MLWVTRQYLHLDRVASPWLILRFVDPQATFQYVPWGQENLASPDAIPLALPWGELRGHDHEACTFDRVARKYGIEDPAVERIGAVVRTGIAYVLEGFRPAANDSIGQTAVGLLAMAEGLMLTHQSDDAILAASLPLYDALHARFRVMSILEARGEKTRGAQDGRGPSAMVEQWRSAFNESGPQFPSAAGSQKNG